MFPPLDEHLVEPEVTREEIIGGRRVVAQPAQVPHATRQFTLDYVLAPHIAPGYTGAADLITRFDVDSDFATDACVYKSGIDPQTGTRHLEEIAFEVSCQEEGEAGAAAAQPAEASRKARIGAQGCVAQNCRAWPGAGRQPSTAAVPPPPRFAPFFSKE